MCVGPVTAAFEAREYVIYHYSTYLTTHVNDFSLRFKTKQNNAILFQTYSTRGHNDFIRAELENGRVKVTIRINGQDQVSTCHTCFNSACISFQKKFTCIFHALYHSVMIELNTIICAVCHNNHFHVF